MKCSQYMKFKNFTFYIQYLCIQLLISIICIIMYKYCLFQFGKICWDAKIAGHLLYVIHDSPPPSISVFISFGVGYHQFKRSHLTSQLIFQQHSTRGTVFWKAFSKAKSLFYWKPFVLWNLFTKPATVSPVCYQPCILIDGHKWEN